MLTGDQTKLRIRSVWVGEGGGGRRRRRGCIHYFSYFCSKHCGHSLNLYFEQKYETYQNFLSENFHFFFNLTTNELVKLTML